MKNELIEKIAKDIYKLEGQRFGNGDWERMAKESRHKYREIAKRILRQKPDSTCIWSLENPVEDNRVYYTGCTDGGTMYFFEAGDVKENGYNYCPYCGGEIKEQHES